MADIAKRGGHAVGDLNGAIVIESDELANGLFGIGSCVERFDWWQAFLGALFGNEFGVGALNLSGIFEHDAGEVARREGAVNITSKTVLNEIGKIAAVIDMRVAEDRGIDCFRIVMKSPIALSHFIAMTLEEAAFHKHALAIDLDEVLRTSGGAGGAVKMNSHGRENGKAGQDCKR